MKTKLVLSLFVVLLILALYKVKPISTYTDDIMAWTLNIAVAQENTFNSQPDVKQWDGEYTKTITFNAKEPPYVLKLTATFHNINGIFEHGVYHNDNITPFGRLGERYEVQNNTIIYKLTRQGIYKIEIISSGCKWNAKVAK